MQIVGSNVCIRGGGTGHVSSKNADVAPLTLYPPPPPTHPCMEEAAQL